MIPTLFAITVIVFVILQIAPGRPGGAESGDSEAAGKQEGQDGYRIFKQQFNLDKPILFNWRFALKDQTIMELLEQKFNRGKNYTPAQKNEANEKLQDYGSMILPQLARIIADPPDLWLRNQALRIFPHNAQRALIHEYGKRLDDESRALNVEIEAENQRVKKLQMSPAMDEAQIRNLVDKVLGYYDDIQKENIKNIIWATGYQYDFSWLKVDTFDATGKPEHYRGVAKENGIYFIGLPWLSMRGSSFIWGVWQDAKYLAEQISKKDNIKIAN